ncbi:MAG: D-aminoacyl-tRNA deacylase [Actinomycetota bacterium]
MRAVVQRVSRASVTVDGEVVGTIGNGLLVLVGVTHQDTDADAVTLADKLVALRIFRDDDDRMNRSVTEEKGGVLIISQFTLYGTVRGGRRPSFVEAAPPPQAEPLVGLVAARIAQANIEVATGRFGAMMMVELINDGPVTLVIETSGGSVV